jgi:hypothetical protein
MEPEAFLKQAATDRRTGDAFQARLLAQVFL